MDEIFKNITVEDMPNEDMKEIAEMVGIENTVKILERFAGITLTIPVNWDKKIIEKYILKHYDGTTECRRRLCRECRVSERYIQKMFKETPGQTKLFDSLDFKASAKR